MAGRRADAPPLMASAAYAGRGFVCGGVLPSRKNVTANLVDRVAGGIDTSERAVVCRETSWTDVA